MNFSVNNGYLTQYWLSLYPQMCYIDIYWRRVGNKESDPLYGICFSDGNKSYLCKNIYEQFLGNRDLLMSFGVGWFRQYWNVLTIPIGRKYIWEESKRAQLIWSTSRKTGNFGNDGQYGPNQIENVDPGAR